MIETKFKYTEVGPIPEDWEVKPLSSIGEMFKGTGIQKSDFVKKGVPCIHYGQIHTSYNSYTFKTLSFVSQDKMKGNNIAHTGDIVIATTSEDVEACCKPVAWLGQEDIAISGDAHIFRHSEHPVFISFLMQTDLFATQKRKVATGTKVTRVHGNDILKFVLPIPKQKEQRRIAIALMDIDSLITDLQALIDKKRNIKQGVMNELLSGKKRLPGFTEEWVEITLGKCCNLLNGFAFQSDTYSKIGKYKIVTITNVQQGQLLMNTYNCINELPINISSHQILCLGDLLVSMTGNVGRVCVVTESNCLLNQRVGLLQVKKDVEIDTEFLFASLNSKSFENDMILKGHGAAQPNIGKTDIEDFSFFIPPTKAEQTAIANILSDMDDEIKQLDAKLSKYQALKQGMMQQLLTGKIRLV